MRIVNIRTADGAWGMALETTTTRSTALTRYGRVGLGVAVLAVSVYWLAGFADGRLVADAFNALTTSPWAICAAIIAYAIAFVLRAAAWHRVQPDVSLGHSWAATHVGLAANHVLPLRMGEVLRVASAVRRTGTPVGETTAVNVALRLGDLLALLAIAAITAPVALASVAGAWPTVAAGCVLAIGVAAAWYVARTRTTRLHTSAVTLAVVGAVTVTAWLLEAAVLYAVAHTVGLELSVSAAIGATAVTVFAQAVAVTPGGLGTYEAAGTVALVAVGHGGPEAFAVVLTTHAVKTVYSLVVGAVALVAPSPGFWGRWRLPKHLPQRSTLATPPTDSAPIVVFMPAHNEGEVIGSVIRRVPQEVAGRPVQVLVIDDGSTDNTADVAREAGATVLPQPTNLGLGAAVRRGLAEAAAVNPAAGVYIDADGEYFPEDIGDVVAPILAGDADYVIGSRFAGRIDRMLPHRRIGNLTLTQWVRWMTRRRDLTDGQSGFRAFSPDALRDAEVIHDYNYAQVLTLDLLSKGFRYSEVPIQYAFRTTGKSFISLGRYLHKVVPAVHRELNEPAPAA